MTEIDLKIMALINICHGAILFVALITMAVFPKLSSANLQTGVSMKCIRTNENPGTKQNHVLMTHGVQLTIEGAMFCTPIMDNINVFQVTMAEELDKLIANINTGVDNIVTGTTLLEDSYSDVNSEEMESECNCTEKMKLFENLVALTETTLNIDALNSCTTETEPNEEVGSNQSSSKRLVFDEPESNEQSKSQNISHKQASDFAALLLSNGLLPFITDDEHLNHRLAYSLVLMNTGHSYEAVKELNSLIKKQPNLNGAYHARGAAYTRQGLEDQEMVNNALNDFNRAIELNRLNPLGWEQRGELNLLLGRSKSALSDISQAIQLRPTAKLFLMRGGLLLKEQKFGFAISDFLSTLKLDNSQPDAFHLVGVSFFHQGKLREATKSIQQAVKMNPNCLDCLQNLGQIYKELGDYDSALEVLNTALALLVEDTQTLYLRGMLQVEGGHVENALNDFQACTDIDPVNTACERMSAVCLTMMGQFYNAVKKTARVMTIAVDEDEGQERDKSMYTREISRYMHAHLDSPISELNMDYDLTARFREGWIRVLNFPIESYVEQPGIGPDISDVDQLGFHDFTPEVQNLICKGLALGNLNEHATDGFLTNSRESLALGLASIEVAQIARKIWRSQRLYKNNAGKRYGWKDLFDISVNWVRACYPDRPVLWLHLMPEHCIQGSCDSFNYQIVLLHGQTFNIRYESYLVNVMNATKKLLVQYLQETSDGDERFLLNLDEINNLEVLLSVMRKKLKDVGSGFIISNRISSHYRRAEKLEGVSFEVKEEKPGTLMFSMTSFTSKKRTDRYHAEMDHIWHQLTEEMQNFRKSANSPREVDFDSVGNLILTLVYYFYNLMPLSGGPSSIAYSVAIGLFIAAGREVTGNIPSGKIVELEAMLANSPSAFTTVAKQWMNLQKSHSSISNLPSVAETFPSLRTMLEVLNTADLTMCKN